MSGLLYAGFILSLLTGCVEDDARRANEAYLRKDYKTAFSIWEKYAEKDFPFAKTKLGVMYTHGLGTEKNPELAKEYLEQGRMQEDARALFELGLIYLDTGDTDRAVEYLERSRAQGYPRAPYYLGQIYEKNASSNEDFAQVYRLYMESYKLGYQNGLDAANRLVQAKGLDFSSIASETTMSRFDPPSSKKVEFSGVVSYQYNTDLNDDLDTGSVGTRESHSVQARLRWHAKLADWVDGMLGIRGFLIDGDSGVDDETGQTFFDKDFFEIRTLWLRFLHVAGEKPLSLVVGRQRLRDPESIWWSREIDAVRLNYDTTLYNASIGVGQNLASYRTDDFGLEEDEKDRLRVFGELSYQWRYDNFLEMRALYEDDHSGQLDIGDVISRSDLDSEDNQLLWFGARARGKWTPHRSLLRYVNYNADLMGVTGRETITNAVTSGSSGTVSVTGNTERDVAGWAIDTSLAMQMSVPLEPLFTVGYAFASGDDNNGTGEDHAFRQTGLQGNAGYSGLSSGITRKYGEALRPELSNIHVASAGVGVPVHESGDVNLFYRYYRLDEPATELRSSSIAATLDNENHFLGQALDLSYNVHLSDEFQWHMHPLDDTRMHMTFGAFKAGDAYGSAKDEIASRATVELQLRF